MRAKSEFVIRQIADEYLLIPVGKGARKWNGLMCLSESGFLLFQMLQDSCDQEDLVRLLRGEYEVSEDTAKEDVDEFVRYLIQLGIVEELRGGEEAEPGSEKL